MLTEFDVECLRAYLSGAIEQADRFREESPAKDHWLGIRVGLQAALIRLDQMTDPQAELVVKDITDGFYARDRAVVESARGNSPAAEAIRQAQNDEWKRHSTQPALVDPA